MAGPDLRLHRVGDVHDHHAARGCGRPEHHRGDQLPRGPPAECPLDGRERLGRRDVAHHGQDAVARREVPLMELDEIVSRDALDRRRRPRGRIAVRVKTVNEAVEDDRRQVARVLVVHPQCRTQLVALPVQLFLGERRRADDVRQQVEAGRHAVPEDRDVREGDVGARADGDVAADRVDGVRDLLRRSRRGALIEQRRHHVRDAELRCQVLGRPGADQHAETHRRLFVMLDHDDAKPVRQGPNLVRRKRHALRRQRLRHRFRWPVPHLRGRRGRSRHQEGGGNRRPGRAPHAPHLTPTSAGFGVTVITMRVSRAKYVCATRWMSAAVMPRKQVEFRVGRSDVALVQHGRAGEGAGLLLDRLPAQYVVARELVLRAGQFACRDGLRAQPVEFLFQRLLRLGRRVAGLHDGVRVEQVGMLAQVADAGGRQRDPGLVHELPVEARAHGRPTGSSTPCAARTNPGARRTSHGARRRRQAAASALQPSAASAR